MIELFALQACLRGRIRVQVSLILLAQQEIIVVDDSGVQIVLAEVGGLNIFEDHQGNFMVILLVEAIGIKVQRAVVPFLREA